jgi:hypothetical protein
MLILANVLMLSYASPAFRPTAEGFANSIEGYAYNKNKGDDDEEAFSNYAPAGAKKYYQAMGAFDGVTLSTGNKSSWRQTSPDEKLEGNYPKFKVGSDNLFMFKDNQCKPSCCGASYSCSGGCVCTTPDQRNFINMRGGNRTAPDAGV